MTEWRIVTDLPRQPWQAYVDQHPAGMVYHTPAMAAVYAATRGYRQHIFAAVDEKSTIGALLPVTEITLAGGPLRLLTTRLVAYGGFLADEGERGQTALAALLASYRRRMGRRALFTELRHQTDVSPWQDVLTQAGYDWEPHLNFLIPLATAEEEIWRRLNRTARKNVRRGEKLLQLQPLSRQEELLAAYRLIEQVYREAHVPVADISLFQAALRHLMGSGMLRGWQAILADGTPAGARLVLLYKGRIWDWYAGALRSARNARPNDFLVWQVLRWGHDNGYTLFDFGGAGHPDRPYGVRNFKAKFGGDLVNYGRSRLLHHPQWLKISEAAYRLWQQQKAKW